MNKSARNIRILHIGKYYPPEVGGIETHLQILSEQLSKSNEVEVLVARARPDGDFLEHAPKVSRIRPLMNIGGAPICPGMIPKIASSRADILHVHLPNPGAVMACLASGFRGCRVATWHSDVVRQKRLARLFAPLLSRFLSSCSAIVVASKEYLNSSDQLRPWVDRCHVIPYGIHARDFDCVDETEVRKIRQRFGPRIVLSAGRLVYYKGIPHLLRAMTQVDGNLLIVGDGPEYFRLEKLSSELGIRSRVAFVGKVEDPRPYYRAADVFVLPSVARSEAFGIVQLEAMASRTPVINTNIPTGVPGVSLNGVTGLTVPPADSEALASALRQLLGDPQLRDTLAHAARRRVVTEFCAEKMAQTTMDLYFSLLSSGHELFLNTLTRAAL